MIEALCSVTCWSATSTQYCIEPIAPSRELHNIQWCSLFIGGCPHAFCVCQIYASLILHPSFSPLPQYHHTYWKHVNGPFHNTSKCVLWRLEYSCHTSHILLHIKISESLLLNYFVAAVIHWPGTDLCNWGIMTIIFHNQMHVCFGSMTLFVAKQSSVWPCCQFFSLHGQLLLQFILKDFLKGLLTPSCCSNAQVSFHLCNGHTAQQHTCGMLPKVCYVMHYGVLSSCFGILWKMVPKSHILLCILLWLWCFASSL